MKNLRLQPSEVSTAMRVNGVCRCPLQACCTAPEGILPQQRLLTVATTTCIIQHWRCVYVNPAR